MEAVKMIKEKMCYEIVDSADATAEGVYSAEGISFRETQLSQTDMAMLEDAISKWEIHDDYEWSEENFVYEDEKSDSGTKIIELIDMVSFKASVTCSSDLLGGYLLKNGEFVGVILQLEQTSSFGMACSQEKDFGVILTDGTTYGKTSKYYSHCSTEKDSSSSHRYHLINKEKYYNN